jgi:hypothetical protein
VDLLDLILQMVVIPALFPLPLAAPQQQVQVGQDGENLEARGIMHQVHKVGAVLEVLPLLHKRLPVLGLCQPYLAVLVTFRPLQTTPHGRGGSHGK